MKSHGTHKLTVFTISCFRHLLISPSHFLGSFSCFGDYWRGSPPSHFHSCTWLQASSMNSSSDSFKLETAAAAAKSLQSCPTLCDPIDGSPPGSPPPWDSPGRNTGVGCYFLLQCMKVKVKVKSLSRVRLLETLWTAAYQAPPSMGFSRQGYWNAMPLPSLNWRQIY